MIPPHNVVVFRRGDDLRGVDPAFVILDGQNGVVVDSQIDGTEPEARTLKKAPITSDVRL